MKKFFSFVATLSLLVGVGCSDKGPDGNVAGKSEFKLEQTEINATAAGGIVEVNYTITNHENGAVVLTECKDNWIKDISTATFGTIKFTVLPNYKQESRETRISVTYTAVEEKFEIVVKQEESSVSAFTFEVAHKDATSILLNITPADITTPYVCRAYTKAHIEAFGLETDYALVEYDLDAINNEAYSASQTWLNYLQNISHVGKSFDISFTNLVPDTEYVIYCYHIDLHNGDATTGEVYREVISTTSPDTLDENITMSFEIDGAHISQTVTTNSEDTYYYTECWAKSDFVSYFGADATPEDIFPRRWNEQVTMKLQSGYYASAIIEQLCHQGTQTIEYNELKADTEYIFYVFGIDPETAFTATDIVIENVTTEEVQDSGMTISIEIKNIFYTTADIYWTASDPNATFRRTVLTKAQYEACGSTDKERFAAFELYGYVNPYTATGSTDLNYVKGEAGVTFVALAFGVDGESPNTRIFSKEFTFMSYNQSSSNITMSWDEHYNLAEVAAVDAENWGDYVYYENYALLPITISGVSRSDDVYYMLDTRPADYYTHEDEWLRDVAQEKNLMNNYKHCYMQLEYEKEYFIIAVAKDKSGNFGKLFKEKLYLYKSESADVSTYSYVEEM